ncbi:DUF4198 domain-containing protein [Solimonas soli]|uniref:DUF4198 domain-containing protein n=1 Tax=Solimonas soli TaxID=413479 RepID=UPI0004AD3D2A|nr:DUF4198 domain-containing protein [Solimonas soli]
MKTFTTTLCLALVALSPLGAQAHKQFFVPSSTVLTENDHGITVDAAVSNDLFYFNHNGMKLDALLITAPDGSAVTPENVFSGKLRSSFDVPLQTAGTYRIASASNGVMASWEEDGQPKRWRGNEATFKTEVPKGAKNLRVTQIVNRVETFVTVGKPSTDVFKPTGVGLELMPVTHPNDLVAGEAATFKLLLDGKPANDIKVTVIPGGTRYRDSQSEITTTTKADGAFTITWPAAGLYWLNASLGGGMEGPGEGGGKPDAAGPKAAASKKSKDGAAAAPSRRVNYSATLEVLP